MLPPFQQSEMPERPPVEYKDIYAIALSTQKNEVKLKNSTHGDRMPHHARDNGTLQEMFSFRRTRKRQIINENLSAKHQKAKHINNSSIYCMLHL